ncbi:MAG: YHS domain-containing protein, partial [Methylocella sp.]
MPWSKQMHDHHHPPQAPSNAIGEVPDMAKDPVCGMDVDRRSAKHSAEYVGHAYYFCSQGCKTKFVADPVSYICDQPKPPALVQEGTIYTCPMHPEIRQTGPGHCPICGMALEPDVASADTGPNPELAGMTRRFWIALALSLPVVVLEMGGHLFNLHMLISRMTSNWIQFALATPVVLWAGWPFFERGARSLATRNLNMFTLIAMGTGVAWAYSAAATLAPGLFPNAFRGSDRAVAIYF